MSLSSVPDPRDDLLAAAVETRIDRDRWKGLALHLEDGVCDDEHCPYRWRIWRAKAEEAFKAAAGPKVEPAIHERVELAEAALVAMLTQSPDAIHAIKAWRLKYAPAALSNVKTPKHWHDLQENR